ncbi:hypothetical protein [Limosilactobacillus fastidiosus]|uniref:Uncharacterized protein n=1 Tax=Limosilactobacillus fastidiosus TaxID=2759855 RepID=A0ABR6E697_9LACO|nr:hypothetical protein [Limosilactobacillus fastidiosus]MBB1062314.1 hypothetical protein [Limosilactobacillus fastidiosus]MCD7083391.1 hypothetical protein [Limosilactobacillus fastidiosus]
MNSEQMKQFEKAKQLSIENKWRDAAAIFLDLRDQVDDEKIIMGATKALYNSNQFKLAYQVAVQSAQVFANDLDFLVQVCLKAQHFISTRALILRYPEEVVNKLLPLVQETESKYRQEFKATVQNQLRAFYHLGDYPLVEQQKRLLAADQLPLADFIVGAKFLLRDPFTQQLVKADILNILQQIKCQEKIAMLCIDEKEHQVIPAKLPTAYQNSLIIECQKILKAQLEQTDPQILRALLIQLDLQSILLNPLIDEVITDPSEWVKVMLKRATTGEYSSENKHIIHWQKKLNKFIDKLQ